MRSMGQAGVGLCVWVEERGLVVMDREEKMAGYREHKRWFTDTMELEVLFYGQAGL